MMSIFFVWTFFRHIFQFFHFSSLFAKTARDVSVNRVGIQDSRYCIHDNIISTYCALLGGVCTCQLSKRGGGIKAKRMGRQPPKIVDIPMCFLKRDELHSNFERLTLFVVWCFGLYIYGGGIVTHPHGNWRLALQRWRLWWRWHLKNTHQYICYECISSLYVLLFWWKITQFLFFYFCFKGAWGWRAWRRYQNLLFSYYSRICRGGAQN